NARADVSNLCEARRRSEHLTCHLMRTPPSFGGRRFCISGGGRLQAPSLRNQSRPSVRVRPPPSTASSICKSRPKETKRDVNNKTGSRKQLRPKLSELLHHRRCRRTRAR